MGSKGNGKSKHALGHNPFEDLILGDDGGPDEAQESTPTVDISSYNDEELINLVFGPGEVEAVPDDTLTAGDEITVADPTLQLDAEPVIIEGDETNNDLAAEESTSLAEPYPDTGTESELEVAAAQPHGNLEQELAPTATFEMSSLEAEIAEPQLSYLEDIITTIDEEIQRVFGESRVELNRESRLRRRADEEQFVIFSLAGAEYAVPAANVREVSEVINLTPVPNVPAWLLGVTNLRGDILSVVELREFLGLEQSTFGGVLWHQALAGAEQKVLVVHPGRDKSAITTALLIDEVKDIRFLTTRNIDKPATAVTEQIKSYLRGVYDDDGQLLVVLDLDRLLLSPEIQQFEPV